MRGPSTARRNIRPCTVSILRPIRAAQRPDGTAGAIARGTSERWKCGTSRRSREDLARVNKNPWLEYLQGRNPGYPETAMAEDLATIKQRVEGIRKDQSKPDKRLADNMLDLNPVTTTALIQLTQGGMEPDRRGNLVNSRLRYFDPVAQARRLAGGCGRARVGDERHRHVGDARELGTTPRTLVVQGGAYAEHLIESVDWNGKTASVGKPNFTVTLAPGAGGKLTLKMRRYASDPTVKSELSLSYERSRVR